VPNKSVSQPKRAVAPRPSANSTGCGEAQGAKWPRKVKRLSPRERMLIRGLAEGKSIHQAALDAGYAEATSRHAIYQTLKLTHIQSALTEALDRAGLSDDALARVLRDALTAERTIIGGSRKEPTILTVPDHPVRMQAYDRVAAARGLVPRVADLPPAPAPPVTVTIRERVVEGGGGVSNRGQAGGGVGVGGACDEAIRSGREVTVTLRQGRGGLESGNDGSPKDPGA